MSFEIISDYSKGNLREIPEKILNMSSLKMLFLEKNLLTDLPDDFFHKLPQLMWLDLRNNKLESLPRSIAHHEHLEHLLLTNNNLKKLPNEIGLVPNLKALQVADNPLVYPPRKVVQEGTKGIKTYLKEQYDRWCAENSEKVAEDEKEKIRNELMEKEKSIREEEKLIKVFNENLNLSFYRTARPSNEISETSKHTLGSQPKSRQSTISNKGQSADRLSRKLSDPKGLYPTLRVKKLDHPSKKQEEPLKIIHDINKSDTKISLKSYYNRPGIKGNLERIPENSLKEGWMNKLRILLNDQERILQQERNLKALSSWRQKKPSNLSDCEQSSVNTSEAPYATYPEYTKIPSRVELTSQLQSFLKQSELVDSKRVQTSKLNLDKLINDLVEQLRDMEQTYSEIRSPRSEIEQAGQQIQTIVDIHKKLLKLKSANDYM